MKNVSLAVLLLCSATAAAQSNVAQDEAVKKFRDQSGRVLDEKERDTAWTVGGNYSLQFNQAAYENWQAGGINSISGNTLLSLYANYDNGGKYTWANSLILGYGVALQDTLFSKTDDRIELESRVDRKLSKKWGLSALLNFRTQFAPGYKNPGVNEVMISDFMAPGYLVTGLGFTYKPNKKLQVFLSPATAKQTFVLNQRLANAGAFGVDSGSNYRLELGGYLNLNYKQKLMDNIEVQGRLNLYSNYLEDPTLIDINSELIFFFKVNKYITANLSLNAIYDHDVKFDVDEDGEVDGPRTQFREILAIGLSYNFGDEVKK